MPGMLLSSQVMSRHAGYFFDRCMITAAVAVAAIRSITQRDFVKRRACNKTLRFGWRGRKREFKRRHFKLQQPLIPAALTGTVLA